MLSLNINFLLFKILLLGLAYIQTYSEFLKNNETNR